MFGVIGFVEKVGYRDSIAFGLIIQSIVYVAIGATIDNSSSVPVPSLWLSFMVMSSAYVSIPITRFSACVFGPEKRSVATAFLVGSYIYSPWFVQAILYESNILPGE